MLNVSQSGVSGQVHALELEIGVKLLRRNHREVALTPEGAVFLAEAREILTHAERAVEMAAQASRGNTGRLSIGLCGPVTALFLPKLIRTFRKRFPAVSVTLKEFAPFTQIRALLEGQIDIGFTRSVPAEMKHLVKAELLFREPVVAAIPKDHALASGERVPVRRLAPEPLILYSREAGPDIFDPILTMCTRARFTPRIAASPDSWSSVLTMVEAGEGIGLIPSCVQQLRSNDVVFRPLQEGGCRLEAIVIWRCHEPQAVLEAMMVMVREKRAEWGIEGPKLRLRRTA